MNEELKIVIKAIASEAEKTLAAVRKEIQGVGKASKQASQDYGGLSGSISEQSKELKQLREQYADAVVKFGEASQEAMWLGLEITTLSGELQDNKDKYQAAMKAADKYDATVNGLGAEVEDLADSTEEADKANSGLAETMSNVKKTVLATTAVITAMVAAMTQLAQSSTDYQKSQSQLKSGFISAGSTAEQAQKTYEGLYRFLGDVDTATEASNLLVRLTQDEQELAEWTQILQGAYASLPGSIPIESLAEAANETAKTGELTGALTDALIWLKVSEEEFQNALNNTNSEAEREALIRGTLNSLYGGAAQLYEQTNAHTLAYNESQARLHSTLAQASYYLTPLLTNLSNLAATLLQVLGPALRVVSAIIITFVQWIVAAAQAIGKFFGAFKGEGSKATNEVAKSVNSVKTSVSGATNGINNMNKGFNDTLDTVKELKRQTMGFDELNVMSSQSSAGGGITDPQSDSITDPGIEIPEIEIPEIDMSGINMDDFEDQLEDVKKRMEGVLVLAGIVGAAFATWGIVHLIKNFDDLKGKMKGVSGTIMIIAGALLLVQGYSDAWANGIDWGNFAMILAGIGLTVGGLALSFGPLVASIGLIVGSIAMLVLGIKDIVENGYSMEAVIMIAVGAIGLLIGVIWALNAALLANPITWIVVAIMALVAAFVILWNECDGFRQFWINLWEKAKEIFVAVWDWIVKFFTETLPSVFNTVINFVKDNWQALLLLLVNPFAGAFQLLYDNCEGFREFIDEWIEKIGQFFKDLWAGIQKTFSNVGQWFSEKFSGAWKKIKDAFAGVGSFFGTLWTTIKSKFTDIGAKIGDAVSGSFSKAINWVLDKAIGIINGFISAINTAISVINAIPGVSISKLSKLEVPQLAKGGIVDSATLAVIGERGKEAVLPLENNTGWMDALADKIANRNGSPSKIVLMLNEKELGWANINSINTITKQTGTLQLSLV